MIGERWKGLTALAFAAMRWLSYLAVFTAGLMSREAIDDWTMIGKATAKSDAVDVALDSGGNLLIIDGRTGTYASYDKEVTRSVVNMYTAFLRDPKPASE